jgi:carbon-monoxide dehydrogenase medium subunit
MEGYLMREVSYYAPANVGEAVKLLAELGGNAAVLAGGTDLAPELNYYDAKPGALLYIGNLGLGYVKEEDGKLVIGAGTTIAQLLANDLIVKKLDVVAQAAATHGSPAIRTAATIGGNLCQASPAGDAILPLMVSDAELVLASAKGERVVAIKDFFTGPGESVRKPDELLIEIRVPLLAGKAAFAKLGRRKAQVLAIVSAAVRLEIEGGVCKNARIAIGSMAPTPVRCTKAEALIVGKKVDEALIAECAAQAIAECSPIDDQRATAWYRKEAGTALVARVLARAAGV